MTAVLERLREGVDHVVRHLTPNHSSADSVEGPALTASERLDLLVRYRSKVGAKPAATETHMLRSQVIMDKLQPKPRPRRGV